MDVVLAPRRRIFTHRRNRMPGRIAGAGFAFLVIALGLQFAFGQERIAARIGSHAGYERAVVDWNGSVDYDVQADGRSVRVVFARPAEIDVAQMVRKFGEVATDIKATSTAEGAVVSFTLSPRVQLRHFRNEKSIVLDFVRSVSAAAPSVDPASARQLAQDKQPRPDRAQAAPLLVPPPPPNVAAARSAAEPPPRASAMPPAPPVMSTPAPPRESRATPSEIPAAVPPPVMAPAAPPQAAAAPPPPVTDSAAVLTMSPLPPRMTGADSLAVEVQPSSIGHRLRFPLKEATPLAVFARGPVIWVVLERRVALDLRQMVANSRDLGPADTMSVESPVTATILRFVPSVRGNVGVIREGEAWVVEVGPRAAPPLRPIEPVIRGNVDGSSGRLVIDMPGVRNTLRLRDPEGNDLLVVAATTTHGAAINALRSYPDFRLLATAQGAVVHALADGVQARVVGDGVDVNGEQPLTVPETQVATDTTIATKRQKLLDLDAWKQAKTPFDEQKQALHRAVAIADAKRRGNDRLALAQFMFANGFVHDALGQMRTLETEAPKLAATPAARLLRGSAAVLADDLEDAERQLAQPVLVANNEAALWRGVLRLRQGDADAASELVLRGVEFAERYPPPVGPRVALAIAEAHVVAGQIDEAERLMELAQRQPLQPADRRQIILMRGQLLARQGDSAGAVKLWRSLEDGGPSPTRAEAILARVQLMASTKQLDRGQAIDALDRLRYAWRGDRVELRTLLALAKLHEENANYRASLLTLRETALLFPTAREAREIATEMDLVFAKLFLDGEADKLSPVQAIALFEEFRDLVPTGPRGDAIARRLVERLVKVDLLARAGQVLEHQARHRATGAERGEIGARLALVRLLDGKPDLALAALGETQDPAIPAAGQIERRRIEARALSELGRSADALSRLDGDVAPDAKTLRLEILRQARDWTGLAKVLDGNLGDVPAGDAPLADEKAVEVLHLATALVLAGDDAATSRLRGRFASAMEASPYRDLFKVLAADPGDRPVDVAAIVQRVNAAAPYQSFLQIYRDKLRTSPPQGS